MDGEGHGGATEPRAQAVRASGVRLTAARQKVIDAIPAEEAFRAEELWGRVRVGAPGVGRATVFRTVAALVHQGLLERLPAPDGSVRYRWCPACRNEHHHHITCAVCGRDELVTGAALQELEQALARAQARIGFAPVSHRLEIIGRCPRCAGAEEGAAAPADHGGGRGDP